LGCWVLHIALLESRRTDTSPSYRRQGFAR